MGYFDWYWNKYGFLKTFFTFFGKKMANDIVYSVFYSGGIAVGSFLMIKYWLPKIA
jgi:hypothetical protein